jgi:hypothetical protein
LNGDTVPSNGKTAVEVLTGAFVDIVDPTITSFSVTDPDYSASATTPTVTLSWSVTNNNAPAGAALTIVIKRKLTTQSDSSYTQVYTESYSAGASISGDTTTNSQTLSAFPTSGFKYKLEVTDDQTGTGTITDEDTSQASYNDPGVSVSLDRVTNSSFTDSGTGESDTNREVGNNDSDITIAVDRQTSGVNITEVRLYRSGSLIKTFGSGTGVQPGDHDYTFQDTTISNTTGVVTYKAQVDDEKSDNDSSSYAKESSNSLFYMNRYPLLLVASSTALIDTSSDNDAQDVFDDASTSNGHATLYDGTESFGSSGKDLITESDSNSISNYTYIIYKASIGDLLNVKQGGSTGINLTLNDYADTPADMWKLGDFNLENSFGHTDSYRIYRSVATKAFNPSLTIFIDD